jgi:DNA mismatch repair protein MutS
MSNILDEYLEYHEIYIKKYGKKTLVLMQVGSFYECYGIIKNKDDNWKGPNLSQISEILNIVCTRKDKSVSEISEKNPYMLGFPLVATNKFINILMENGYTIIIIDQVTPPPKPKREVTNIYSPGTYIEGQQKPDTNYIVSIYLEEESQKNTKSLLCSGMSAVDLTTGKVIINEVHSNSQDDKIALDETIRFIASLNPKELIIHHKSKDKKIYNEEFIKSYLELDNKYFHYKSSIDPKYYKISYQNEFLKKIYKNTGQISPIEYLDLDKFIYATLSFILLLDFSYDHNEKIIFNLEKPEYYSDSKHLILGNNAIFQLNIVSSDVYEYNNNKFKSLFDVVNNTSTPMGRRLLKDRLLYPLINSENIQKDYNLTEKFIENNIYVELEKYLREITDLERLERKISLSMIQPYELYEFIMSHKNAITIIEFLEKENKAIKKDKILLKDFIPNSEIINNIKNFIKESERVFYLEELKKQNLSEISNNFFNDGIYNEIDELIVKLGVSNDFMNKLCKVLSTYIDDKKKIKSKDDKISIKKNDRDGHYLNLTKLRCEQLNKKLQDLKEINVEGYKLDPKKLVFKEQNNTVKIFFPDLEKKSDEIEETKNKINKIVRTKFTETLKDFHNKFNNSFRKMSNFISHLDFIKSSAKTAKLYNYTKPIIENEIDSFISCKNLRHPIIERIIDYEYVPHDFNMGNKDLKGMLIFGINSSGKSSLMKSAGLSIVMAQAGLYVPATEYKYSPYHSLYTRITGNDNLFKGLSSFALEMVELKAILKRATPKTLVIGDEVCRGTEHISGNAIVATTIINLAKSNSSFIFATHLHELAQMERIKNLEKVKAFHLSISYDSDKDEIVYDRKLKAGSGDNIYGITVARHIIHDKEFIDLALEIKNELLESHNSMISGKTSRYNSDVLIYQCQVCGEKEKNGKISNLETHHINFQKDCVDGFVKNKPHIKKNDKSNLVVLCNECHDKIHADEIKITGTIMSSNGKKIKIEKNNKKTSSN